MKEIPYVLSLDGMLATQTSMWISLATGIAENYRVTNPKCEAKINSALSECIQSLTSSSAKIRTEAAAKGIK